MDLRKTPDHELLSDVAKLLGAHRELTARLVAHLAEIEDRRLHLFSGFSSMFDFCQKKLGMSEGEAFRRILAARLSRHFPGVISRLATGNVNLSTLELVRDRLTDENHEELLDAVAHRSKREVMEYLAARFPRPDTPSRIRPLASIEPLTENRFKVEFTASDTLCKKLERCRDLMSHANPSRDLAVVIERALDLLLADLQGKRLGKLKRPREASTVGTARASERKPSGFTKVCQPFGAASSPRLNSRRIDNATRRAVFERDGLRCTYVAESGRRCEAQAFLELDHVDPRALGGSNGADNLRVLCRAHNQLRAEQAFGRDEVERSRHLRQKKSTAAAARKDGDFREQETTSTTGERNGDFPRPTLEKVRLALRGLGFRGLEVRRTLAAIAKGHGANEPLALERALRDALFMLTAA
jgi:hypothetical protein